LTVPSSLNVDFATRFLDDAFDILAAWPDQGADLLGTDLDVTMRGRIC